MNCKVFGKNNFYKLDIMNKEKLKKLNRELSRNIVKFEWCKDVTSDLQSLCFISIGGIPAVETYALDGLEEEVLHGMVAKYWGIDKSFGVN